MMGKRALQLLLAAMLALPLIAAADDAISIRGHDWYRDGHPWQAKGVDVNAFVKPPKYFSFDKDARLQRSYWGETELQKVRERLGADTIRFHLSQAGLDPESKLYDPIYVHQVLEPIQLARKQGFAVIAVIDAQQDGLDDVKCMPSASTARAWKTLAPHLAGDAGVMFELFNEPCKKGDAAVQEWTQEMQQLIDAVRGQGARNILLLDGLDWARITNDLFPLVHDKEPERMALAIHPYLVGGAFDRQKQWQDKFGASAATYPAMATEWNATPTNGCSGKNMPDAALALVRYLQSLHLGLVEWGIESTHGRIVKDHQGFDPTDYAGFKDCKDGSASGAGSLLAKYPHN